MTNRTNTSRVVLTTAHVETPWLERLQRLSPDPRFERWPTRSVGAVPDDLWQEVEILYTFATCPGYFAHPRSLANGYAK